MLSSNDELNTSDIKSRHSYNVHFPSKKEKAIACAGCIKTKISSSAISNGTLKDGLLQSNILLKSFLKL